VYLTMLYLPLKSHFLNNDKSYKRDFFTINTFNQGLSFGSIESALLSYIFGLVGRPIFRRENHVDKASWSDQRARIAREQSHLKEHIKLH